MVRAFSVRAMALAGAVLVAPLAGAAAVIKPAVLLAPLGAALLVAAFATPIMAVGALLFAHVATPIYMRVPVPGIHEVPVSITWMLALLVVGVLSWLAGAQPPPRFGPQGRRASRFFLVFMVVALTSLLDPLTRSESFKIWALALGFPSVAFAIIVCAARTVEDVRRLSVFLVAGGAVASVYAVYEFALGVNPLLDHYQIEAVSGYYTRFELGSFVYRAFSVYLNPIEFGAVMGMIFPFAAIRMATAETRRERIAFAVLSALIALGVMLSVSRGPMLGLACAALILGTVYTRLRPWIVAAAVGAALALAVAWPIVGSQLSERVNDADNVTLRLKLFQAAIAVFVENPLRGVGLGNFSDVYLEAIREHHIGPFYEFEPDRVEKVRVAENAYLQLAAETGIIGIAAAAAAAAALLHLCLRLARTAPLPEAQDAAIAVLVVSSVYAVNALTVTAYTLYGPTLLMTGVLPAFAIVLDRAVAGAPRPATIGGEVKPRKPADSG